MTDPVFVERSSTSSRQNVFKKVLEKVEQNSVLFLPEGNQTRFKA